MIQKLLNALAKQPQKTIHIPAIWNAWNLPVKEQKDGLHIIDEASYLQALLKHSMRPNIDFSLPISKVTKEEKWLDQSVAYSMMIRTSSAWDYNNNQSLEANENGTFIRTLFLLPYLKRMGVTLLYLLPISKYSLENKKGELGSVYGVSNFFAMDPNLKHDTPLSIEEEFQCLVEACHMLDIRVMIDLIPRTNSVNSELIADHPDWFYWIKQEEYEGYYPPAVPAIGNVIQPNHENLPLIYSEPNVQAHIQKFVAHPGNHPKWKNIKHDLSLVEQELGIRVAPAFSDHVNDQQPPWTDVTFFRLYLDHPKAAQAFVSPETPPYILFDTIKGNVFQGDIINEELWDVLASIIPHYQQFGIDGARIDMGHALPKDLTGRIVKRAKDFDHYFSFIAEESIKEKSNTLLEDGYDMMIGNGFYFLPRYTEGKTKEYYFGYKDNPIPVFANAETHDTKRVASRAYGGAQLAEVVTLLNYFMPNGVPFINSGQELYEIQPMNLGVDCELSEQFILPKDDFNYGKLALFDPYQFHYLDERAPRLITLMEEVVAIKNQYPQLFKKQHCSFIEYEEVLGFSYNDGTNRIEVLGNFSLTHTSTVAPVEILFAIQEKNHYIAPMEVKILRF